MAKKKKLVVMVSSTAYGIEELLERINATLFDLQGTDDMVRIIEGRE